MAELLLADDSEFSRQLLRDLLASDHDIVGEVENGVEAVEVCDELAPDVAVMAVRMPIRDGIEAAEEITSARPGTGVVLCSAIAEEETIREAREAGADGYVTKPFQKQGLVEAVSDALPS